VILDTQFLDRLVEQDEAALRTAAELDAGGAPTRLPSTVVWELSYGIGKLADEGRAEVLRRAYERLFASRSPLEPDAGVARRAGLLRGRHAASDEPRTLDGAESFVAAHGLTLDEAVVSNDADFRDVEGLRVETF
jgi:predicted nucleic acid-binding protein